MRAPRVGGLLLLLGVNDNPGCSSISAFLLCPSATFLHRTRHESIPAVQVAASEPVLVQVGGELNWVSVIIIGALPIDSSCRLSTKTLIRVACIPWQR